MIRIYNARILTMKERTIENGEIWVDGKIIKYVGPSKISDITFSQEIDAKRNLIMPSFKNAHAHSAMTFARSYADGYPLDIWLNNHIFPLEAKLTAENIYTFSLLAYMEYFSSGITANFDMYYEPDAIVNASVEAGMKTVLCGAINNFKESPDILEGYYKKFNNVSDLISYTLGFHAEYTTSLQLIKEIGELAKKYKAPVFVHNAETKNEVIGCIDRYGMTPTQLFEECGLYDYGGGGFHCVYLDDKDIDIFRRRQLNIVINSCSNVKLASGIAPVKKYFEEGINIALGTDGASSNNALDMFREMYMTSVLQKVQCEDPVAIDAFDIIKMATINSAKTMGLNNSTTIEVGNSADIIMLDMSMPNMQPENDIVNNIVYSAGKHNVVMTMINGRIVYQDGEYLTIDKERIIFEANKMMNSLKKNM